MATKEEKKKSEKINIEKYEGHTEGPWWINHEDGDGATSIWNGTIDEGNMNHVADVDDAPNNMNDLKLMADAPLLLAEVKQSQLKEYAIIQAEHMKAQVGDNTWHYAMEVWLYPETHYWGVEDEVALIERYISTNRDAWVKHWGEPSDMVQRRNTDHELREM